MDEATCKKITKIIIAASVHFGVPLYNEKVILQCLKRPETRRAQRLKEKLKDLLIHIVFNSPGRNKRQFWNLVKSSVMDGIDRLSGKKEMRCQSRLSVPRSLSISTNVRDVRQILQKAELQCLVPFWFAAPELFDPRSSKIAEGSFGEVYHITKSDGSERILKIIPIGNVSPLDDENQFTLQEITPEITASIELSKLIDGQDNRCSIFPKVYKVCLVQDAFPPSAVEAWRSYSMESVSEHPSPDMYEENQVFATIETNMGGVELSSVRLDNYLEALSIFNQVVAAIAISEEVLKFEHRDLHVSNVLVEECVEKYLHLIFRGRKWDMETYGVKAMIIDFTFSRLSTEDGVQYLELDQLFDSVPNCRNKYKDNRYIYSKMEQVVAGDWKEYNPRTNILWMKHIAECLLKMVENRSKMSVKEEYALFKLRTYNHACITYDSVSEFFQECVFPCI